MAEAQTEEDAVEKKSMVSRRIFVSVSLVALIVLSATAAWGLFGLGRHGSGTIASFAETLHGLNHDMKQSLKAIQAGEAHAVEPLHDQLHLMRDIFHLVGREHRDEPAFQGLHDLNHEMRETWHQVKRGRDREQNLAKLENQLEAMRQALHDLRKE